MPACQRQADCVELGLPWEEGSSVEGLRKGVCSVPSLVLVCTISPLVTRKQIKQASSWGKVTYVLSK